MAVGDSEAFLWSQSVDYQCEHGALSTCFWPSGTWSEQFHSTTATGWIYNRTSGNNSVRWVMEAKVFMKTGETVQDRAILYKAVVQTGFLYGSKRWVVMGAMLKVLEGFHHRVTRRIKGKTYQRMVNREWEWPQVEDTLEIEGIWTIKKFINLWQATIAENFAFQNIYELCIEAEKILGSS